MNKISAAGRMRLGFLILTAVVGALAVPVAPASAATLSGGNGIEVMTGVPFSLPPSAPCAHYTNYKADVVFPNAASSVNATITSNPTTVWNEGPEGTHPWVLAPTPGSLTDNTCGGNPTAIPGFTAVLVGGGYNCAGNATYLRNDIDITVTLSGAPLGISNLPTCPSTTLRYSLVYVTAPTDIPPFFQQGDPMAACPPIIAPATCVIGDQHL